MPSSLPRRLANDSLCWIQPAACISNKAPVKTPKIGKSMSRVFSMPSSTQASGQLALPLRLFAVLPVQAGHGLLFPWSRPPVFLSVLDADFGCLCSEPSSQLHVCTLLAKPRSYFPSLMLNPKSSLQKPKEHLWINDWLNATMNLFWNFRPFDENRKTNKKTAIWLETLNPYSFFQYVDAASLSLQGREGWPTHPWSP